MYNALIKLSNVDDVKEFVSLAKACEFPISLKNESDYQVDAKSMMGIFVFDLTKPIQMEAQCAPDAPFAEQVQKFIAK